MTLFFSERNRQRGFTLIELLIVVSITSFMFVSVVTKFNRSSLATTRVAGAIITEIRATQTRATSGATFQADDEVTAKHRCGYGIMPVSARQYRIFAGPAPSGQGVGFCSSQDRLYQSGIDKELRLVTLSDPKLEFKLADGSDFFREFFFEPPDPKTFIENSATSSTLPSTIVLGPTGESCTTSTACQVVCVYVSGRVETQSGATCSPSPSVDPTSIPTPPPSPSPTPSPSPSTEVMVVQGSPVLPQGGRAYVSWSRQSGTGASDDWIALLPQGADWSTTSSNDKSWIWWDGTINVAPQTPALDRASELVVVPSGTSVQAMEFVYYKNTRHPSGEYIELGRSSPVPVVSSDSGSVTLSIPPNPVPQGSSVVISWEHAQDTPGTADWVALVPEGKRWDQVSEDQQSWVWWDGTVNGSQDLAPLSESPTEGSVSLSLPEQGARFEAVYYIGATSSNGRWIERGRSSVIIVEDGSF